MAHYTGIIPGDGVSVGRFGYHDRMTATITEAPSGGDAPRPLRMVIHDAGPDVSAVISHWRDDDAARCRRCPVCNAWPAANTPGMTVCSRLAPGVPSPLTGVLEPAEGGAL